MRQRQDEKKLKATKRWTACCAPDGLHCEWLSLVKYHCTDRLDHNVIRNIIDATSSRRAAVGETLCKAKGCCYLISFLSTNPTKRPPSDSSILSETLYPEHTRCDWNVNLFFIDSLVSTLTENVERDDSDSDQYLQRGLCKGTFRGFTKLKKCWEIHCIAMIKLQLTVFLKSGWVGLLSSSSSSAASQGFKGFMRLLLWAQKGNYLPCTMKFLLCCQWMPTIIVKIQSNTKLEYKAIKKEQHFEKYNRI